MFAILEVSFPLVPLLKGLVMLMLTPVCADNGSNSLSQLLITKFRVLQLCDLDEWTIFLKIHVKCVLYSDKYCILSHTEDFDINSM